MRKSLQQGGGGVEVFGKKVLPPSQIAHCDYDRIFIAAHDTEAIKIQLAELGVNLGKIDTALYDEIRNKSQNSRIIALKNAAQIIYENNIAGAVAELGVYEGEFAKHMNAAFPDRMLYLFDTFSGFAAQDLTIEDEITGTFAHRMFQEIEVNSVMNKMKYPQKCIVRKGSFPSTAMGVEDAFAFVSLDADLYQPMWEGLRYFYPRLNIGGFIFVHDYFSYVFTGVRKAVETYSAANGIKFTPLGDDCSICITK
jgi:O-methyltransferase